MKNVYSILLAVLALAGLSMTTGCDTVDAALQNDAVKQISISAAKTLLDLGLSAVIANNPDYATELGLAKEALTLQYSTVFAEPDGEPLTLAQLAANLRTQLAANITDPAMVAALQAQLAAALSDLTTSDTPAASASGENIPALGRSLAIELGNPIA